MAREITQRFIDALHRLEESQDTNPITELFSDDAQFTSASRSFKPRGKRGAHEFWDQYRHAFDRIHCDFTSVKEGDGFAVLEWHGSGTQRHGEPVEYDGVSVIEFDGDHIRRFATYFDPRVFQRDRHGRKSHGT